MSGASRPMPACSGTDAGSHIRDVCSTPQAAHLPEPDRLLQECTAAACVHQAYADLRRMLFPCCLRDGLEICFLGIESSWERAKAPLIGQDRMPGACACCRKYREGSWEHVRQQLLQEKKNMEQNKQRGAAYVLGARQETPGVFYVAYVANVNPHKEFMTVTPNGVYFRHEVGDEASGFRS